MKKPGRSEALNILVIFSNRLGDTILSIPFLYSIKEHYPNCNISCLVSSELREFTELVPIVEKVYTKVKGTRNRFSDILATSKTIRKGAKIDLCF